MKKKRTKSTPAKKTSKSRKSVKYNSGFLPYLVSGLVTLLILFLFINYYNATRNPNVLGISSVLAKNDALNEEHHDPSNEIPMERDGNSGQSGQFNPERNMGQQEEAGHVMTADASGRKPPPQKEPPHMNLSGTPIPPHGRGQDMENHEGKDENEDAEFHSATNSSGFIFRHKGVEAETENELEHDPEATSSNQLLLTTPSGKHHISVLPDQAIQNVLAHNKLTQILSDDASSSADLTKIKLTVKNDKPVYEIKGIKKEKFFGLIPVDIHKTTDVSAEDGEVVNSSESFGSGLLDLLSF